MSEILIIEDDRMLNRGVAFALKRDGHEVYSTYSLAEGRAVLTQKKIEFLLLDINLPDGSGLTFCKEIRNQYSFPIVFFTANDTEEDMVKGFDLGCDDYIAKPFSVEVLKRKVTAMLRKREDSTDALFSYEQLAMDYDKKRVSIAGDAVRLTANEYKLLELFCKNKGKVLTKEVLLGELWDAEGNYVDENTLSVTVRRLRNKIEEDVKHPKYITTVFGIGYILGES